MRRAIEMSRTLRSVLSGFCCLSLALAASAADPPNPFDAPPKGQPANPFDSPPGTPARPKPPKPAAATEEKPADTEEKPAAVKPKPTTPEPAPEAEQVAEIGPKAGVEWTAAPDASAFPPLGNAKVSIPVSGLTSSADLRWERTRLRVLFPQIPSLMVALGVNEKTTDIREVWDIANAKKLGQITKLDLEGSQLMALSPDGRHFAAKPQFDEMIKLQDVVADRTIKTLQIADMRPDLLAFRSNTELLLGEDGKIQVYALPAFKKDREFPIADWVVRDGWSLSPGGKYLTAVIRKSGLRQEVRLIDLTSGETAGAIVVAAGDADCQGIAFSLDGMKLAAKVEADARTGIEVFDVATGARSTEYWFDGQELARQGHYQGPSIEWAPGAVRLIVDGQFIVNTSSGAIESKLTETLPYAMKPIGERLYLAVDRQKLVARKFGDAAPAATDVAAVTPMPDPGPSDPVKPKPEPSTSAALDHAPPLKEGDRTEEKRLTLKSPSRWSVRLQAPPVYADKLDTNGFKIPGGLIQQILLAVADPPMAVVSYSSGPITNAGAKTWVELIALKDANPKNHVDFSFPAVAVAVSPAAREVATLDAAGTGRLDVWSLEHDRRIAGFLPAEPADEDAIPWYVDFADDEHLAVAVGNKLTMWRLPDCKAIYSVEIGDMRPAFSPAHDCLAVAKPNTAEVVVLDAISGEPQGAVTVSKYAGERVMAAAFHHRGRWLACLTGAPSGGELAIVDTVAGEDTVRSRLPVSGDVLQWCGDDHVLIDGNALVDIRAETVVWRYELPLGFHCRESVDGRHWYAAAVTPTDKFFLMVGAALPEEAILRKISSSAFSKRLLFQPGDNVRLNIPVDHSGPRSVGDILAKSLSTRYSEADINVSDEAGATLTVRPYSTQPIIDPRATTETAADPDEAMASKALGPLARLAKNKGGAAAVAKGGSTPDQEAEISNVWEMSLTFQKQLLWRTWVVGSGDSVRFEQDEATAVSEKSTNPAEVRLVVAALMMIEPPKFGFAPGAASGAGTSQLTTRGAVRPNK
jgi:hypothetical protein